MTFRLVYVDNGDVVGAHDSYEAAHAALAEFLQQHPHLDDEICIQQMDDTGHPAGDAEVGIAVAGQQMQLN